MLFKKDFVYSPNGKNRPLHIYVPDLDEGERVPVMYFFDGHNLFLNEDATYGTAWGLSRFLDRWHKKMIIVGMECGHEGDERLNEYLPYPVHRGFLSRFEGIGDETMRWIVGEVKPFVDAELPVLPFRECTGIGGSSMGGLMALYGAVRYNSRFSKAACLSSAVGFCMPALTRDIRTCPISPDTRVTLSWGSREALGKKDEGTADRTSPTFRRNRALAYALRDRGCAVRLHCQSGGEHCERDWGRQLSLVMNFLWPD